MAHWIAGISSMATRQILAEAIALYARRRGSEVAFESVGGVEAARRVRAGASFDLVALASDSLEMLETEGFILPGSRVGFARSPMAVAVPAGTAKPDISDEASVRKVTAAARSVGYSTGPSGTHVVRLLKDWGLDERRGPKLVQATPGVPVGKLVASGKAEIGFQQLSELMDEKGIEIVGLLPPEIQSVTLFSIGVGTKSPNAEEARSFVAFLTSKELDEIKRRHGMEPA